MTLTGLSARSDRLWQAADRGRSGLARPASRCSSSSIMKKAARTASGMAMRRRKLFSRRSRWSRSRSGRQSRHRWRIAAATGGPIDIDMMKVNVRQERADHRALRRPLLRLDQVSIFEHACRQPFGNQPDNSPVANPMFDEADQPILVNLVEKGLNVAVEYPVDPPLPRSRTRAHPALDAGYASVGSRS